MKRIRQKLNRSIINDQPGQESTREREDKDKKFSNLLTILSQKQASQRSVGKLLKTELANSGSKSRSIGLKHRIRANRSPDRRSRLQGTPEEGRTQAGGNIQGGTGSQAAGNSSGFLNTSQANLGLNEVVKTRRGLRESKEAKIGPNGPKKLKIGDSRTRGVKGQEGRFTLTERVRGGLQDPSFQSPDLRNAYGVQKSKKIEKQQKEEILGSKSSSSQINRFGRTGSNFVGDRFGRHSRADLRSSKIEKRLTNTVERNPGISTEERNTRPSKIVRLSNRSLLKPTIGGLSFKGGLKRLGLSNPKKYQKSKIEEVGGNKMASLARGGVNRTYTHAETVKIRQELKSSASQSNRPGDDFEDVEQLSSHSSKVKASYGAESDVRSSFGGRGSGQKPKTGETENQDFRKRRISSEVSGDKIGGNEDLGGPWEPRESSRFGYLAQKGVLGDNTDYREKGISGIFKVNQAASRASRGLNDAKMFSRYAGKGSKGPKRVDSFKPNFTKIELIQDKKAHFGDNGDTTGYNSHPKSLQNPKNSSKFQNQKIQSKYISRLYSKHSLHQRDHLGNKEAPEDLEHSQIDLKPQKSGKQESESISGSMRHTHSQSRSEYPRASSTLKFSSVRHTETSEGVPEAQKRLKIDIRPNTQKMQKEAVSWTGKTTSHQTRHRRGDLRSSESFRTPNNEFGNRMYLRSSQEFKGSKMRKSYAEKLREYGQHPQESQKSALETSFSELANIHKNAENSKNMVVELFQRLTLLAMENNRLVLSLEAQSEESKRLQKEVYQKDLKLATIDRLQHEIGLLRSERDELEARVASYMKERSEMVMEIENLKLGDIKKSERLEDMIHDLEQDKGRMSSMQHDLRAELASAVEKLDLKVEVISAKEIELEQVKAVLGGLEDQVHALESENGALSKEKVDFENLVEELNLKISGLNLAEGELRRQNGLLLTQIGDQETSLKAEIDILTKLAEIVKNDLDETRRDLAARDAEFDLLTQKKTEFEVKIEELSQEKIQKSEEISELKRSLDLEKDENSQLRARLNALTTKIQDLDAEINQNQEILLNREKVISDLQIQLGKTKGELETLQMELEISRQRSKSHEEASGGLKDDLEALKVKFRQKEEKIADLTVTVRNFEDNVVPGLKRRADDDRSSLNVIVVRLEDEEKNSQNLKIEVENLTQKSKNLERELTRREHEMELGATELESVLESNQKLKKIKREQEIELDAFERENRNFSREIEQLQHRRDLLEQDIEKRKQDFEEIRLKLESGLRDKETVFRDFRRIEMENMDLGNKIGRLEAQNQRLEQQKSDFEQKLGESISAKNELEMKIYELERAVQRLEGQNVTLEGRLEGYEQDLGEKDKILGEAKSELEGALMEIESREGDVLELEERVRVLEGRLEGLGDELKEKIEKIEKLESRASGADSELIEVREQLSDANEVVNELEDSLKRSKNELNDKNAEIQNFKNQQLELENRIEELNGELRDAENQLRTSETELRDLRIQHRDQLSKIENFEIEVARLDSRAAGLDKENRELRETAIETEKRVYELENLENQLQSKIENLGSLVQETRENYDSERSRNTELHNENLRIDRKASNLESELQAKNRLLEDSDDKIRQLEAQIRQGEAQARQLEAKIDELGQKNKKLDELKWSLENQITELNRKLGESERQIKDLEYKIEGFVAREKDFSQKIEILENRKIDLEKSLRDSQGQLRAKEDEIERFRRDGDTQKVEIEKFGVLLENTKIELSDAKNNAEAHRRQHEDQQRLNKELVRENSSLEVENSKLTKMIENSRKALKELESDNQQRGDELRALQGSLQAEKRQLTIEIEKIQNHKIRLETSIKGLEGDREKLREQLRAAELDLKAKIAENENLARRLKSSESAISGLQGDIKHLNEHKLIPLEQQISSKNREIDNLTSELSKLKMDLNRLKTDKSHLEGDNQHLENTIQRLKTAQNGLNAEIDSWREKYKKLEKESREIINKWSREREKIFEENQKLQFIASDRLAEIEKKSWENEKLLMRLGLVYAELERLYWRRKKVNRGAGEAKGGLGSPKNRISGLGDFGGKMSKSSVYEVSGTSSRVYSTLGATGYQSSGYSGSKNLIKKSKSPDSKNAQNSTYKYGSGFRSSYTSRISSNLVSSEVMGAGNSKYSSLIGKDLPSISSGLEGVLGARKPTSESITGIGGIEKLKTSTIFEKSEKVENPLFKTSEPKTGSPGTLSGVGGTSGLVSGHKIVAEIRSGLSSPITENHKKRHFEGVSDYTSTYRTSTALNNTNTTSFGTSSSLNLHKKGSTTTSSIPPKSDKNQQFTIGGRNLDDYLASYNLTGSSSYQKTQKRQDSTSPKKDQIASLPPQIPTKTTNLITNTTTNITNTIINRSRAPSPSQKFPPLNRKLTTIPSVSSTNRLSNSQKDSSSSPNYSQSISSQLAGPPSSGLTTPPLKSPTSGLEALQLKSGAVVQPDPVSRKDTSPALYYQSRGAEGGKGVSSYELGFGLGARKDSALSKTSYTSSYGAGGL